MKINEILINPSREDYLEKYYHYFRDSNKIPAFKQLNFSENILDEYHYLGLFENEKLISYLELELRDLEMFQVSYAQTDPKFRGQGCFRYLLTRAVIKHDQILSDDRQTAEAKFAWESLIKYSDGTFRIYLYDIKTKTILGNANTFTETEIWDNKDTILLIKKEINAEGLIEHTIRNSKSLISVERDHYGLWYGPRSSNDIYENP